MAVEPHCPVVLSSGELAVPSVPGLGTVLTPTGTPRGVAMLLHGLNGAAPSFPETPQDMGTGGILPLYYGTWASDLVSDGWVVLYPTYPEDAYPTQLGGPPHGIWTDITTDPEYGARYYRNLIRLAQHWVGWANMEYPGKALTVMGMSEGGYHTLAILSALGQFFVGGIAHCPATIWSNVSSLFTTSTDDFGPYLTTGLDLSPTCLNAVKGPTLVSFGTNDAAVGWTQTAVAAASNGVDVTTFTGAGSLAVATPADMIPGVSVQVTTVTNGVPGTATIRFTGTSSTDLTGCTLLRGTGTLATGGAVIQSLTTEIISNAQAAGAPVTSNQTTDNHELLLADEKAFKTFWETYLDPLT